MDRRIQTSIAASLVLTALTACGGGNDPSGSYAGTLDGNFTDMDAPGADGTGMNRTFQFHESMALVITKLGDNAYRFALGTCSMSAEQVGSLDAPILATAGSCAIHLEGHDEMTLTGASATISLHDDHAEATFSASGARHPDGMVPALNGIFAGDRPH